MPLGAKAHFTLLCLLLVVSCRQTPSLEFETIPAPGNVATAGSSTESPTESPAVQETATTPLAPATPSPPPLQTPTAEPAPPVPEPESSQSPLPPGALIQTSIDGQVGVLLDEFPGSVREQMVSLILDQSEEVWRARAERQVRLTKRRLNFRNFHYEGKGQLPLPPRQLWSINLDPAGPTRQTIQGHDLITMDYSFSSLLLTGADAPGEAEPALDQVGGVWLEPMLFPIDPDHLLQRTGNACLNEAGFPPNSFDSENVWDFYDFSCEAGSGGALGCHRTRLPELSCRQALAAHVGGIETPVRFERLPWDEALAATVRLGPLPVAQQPDLAVVGQDLATNRIVYRYIEPDNCALEEGAVGGSGWRRLLQFSATIQNVGERALHVGSVVTDDPATNLFDYSLCHDHFHYTHYGEFTLDTPDPFIAGKQAFCVQSTDRYSNNEFSPLTHTYSCRFQGIQTGWVDEYGAGLDTQWLDITDLETPPEGIAVQLGFASNVDKFLCEGALALDASGAVVWEPSGLETEHGIGINRPKCDFIADWDLNNSAALDLFIPPSGSFITAPCSKDDLSPLRNCGFTERAGEDATCAPGAVVGRNVPLEDVSAPQILRVCERSALLQSGVACAYEDAMVNVILDNRDNQVSFTCPRIRDAENFSGGYALYAAPLYPAVAESQE
jgi:hypothetical protein